MKKRIGDKIIIKNSIYWESVCIDNSEKIKKTDISKAKIGILNSSDYLKVIYPDKDNIKKIVQKKTI